MPDLWTPGLAGPHEDFVARLHRQIGGFALKHDVESPVVYVELRDGARYLLDSISPEPGYGFVTISPHPGENIPEELVVPIGAIGRIEMRARGEEPETFGFTLPEHPERGPEA